MIDRNSSTRVMAHGRRVQIGAALLAAIILFDAFAALRVGP